MRELQFLPRELSGGSEWVRPSPSATVVDRVEGGKEGGGWYARSDALLAREVGLRVAP